MTLTVRLIPAQPSYTPLNYIQLNFWSFAIMFVLAAVAFNYWLRFRYLNVYSEFQEPPLVKSDAQELHPDVNSPDPPTTFHNYLDDFLQAVRVFGFLEKPVRLSYHFAHLRPNVRRRSSTSWRDIYKQDS